MFYPDSLRNYVFGPLLEIIPIVFFLLTSCCCRGELVVRISTFGKHLGADRKEGSEVLFLVEYQQSGV